MVKKKKRVVVAMSGGVDSSVAAALLKDDGYDVVGITMQIWPATSASDSYSKEEHSGGCCSLPAVEDAKRVANRLGISHYVINFRKIFKEKVIDNFIQEYKKGRTPNPCIKCNKFIKFDELLRRSRELNADFVATGHYARIECNRIPLNPPFAKGEEGGLERWLLKKGRDINKDQSYVLYPLLQEQLRHILFPLGNLSKKEVREIARKKGLLVADKKESQEICFIPDNDYGRFLETQIDRGITPGLILDVQGKILGRHRGVIFYTIGQRRGIGISNRVPLYVLNINPKDNTIVVGPDEMLYRDELIAGEVNYISIKKLSRSIRADVKIRYKHEASQTMISPIENEKVRIKFARPQRAITPGQSAVFYEGDVVVGGGIIIN